MANVCIGNIGFENSRQRNKCIDWDLIGGLLSYDPQSDPQTDPVIAIIVDGVRPSPALPLPLVCAKAQPLSTIRVIPRLLTK